MASPLLCCDRGVSVVTVELGVDIDGGGGQTTVKLVFADDCVGYGGGLNCR